MGFPEVQDGPRVGNGGIDFQPVANDSWIVEQPGAIRIAVGGHQIGNEVAVRPPERLSLLENGDPGKPRLVDFQQQPLE
jgi:hypothetical protein